MPAPSVLAAARSNRRHRYAEPSRDTQAKHARARRSSRCVACVCYNSRPFSAASAKAQPIKPFDREIEMLPPRHRPRSEEHTSELQSLMRISYAVFCLKTKQTKQKTII